MRRIDVFLRWGCGMAGLVFLSIGAILLHNYGVSKGKVQQTALHVKEAAVFEARLGAAAARVVSLEAKVRALEALLRDKEARLQARVEKMRAAEAKVRRVLEGVGLGNVDAVDSVPCCGGDLEEDGVEGGVVLSAEEQAEVDAFVAKVGGRSAAQRERVEAFYAGLSAEEREECDAFVAERIAGTVSALMDSPFSVYFSAAELETEQQKLLNASPEDPRVEDMRLMAIDAFMFLRETDAAFQAEARRVNQETEDIAIESFGWLIEHAKSRGLKSGRRW